MSAWLILIGWLLVFIGGGIIAYLIKTRKRTEARCEDLEKKNDALLKEQKEIEGKIETVESMETGSGASDFKVSIDVLSDLAKGKRK